MTSVKEMTEYLGKILNAEIKNLYELTSKVKSLEQAIKVLDYLAAEIAIVNEDDNPHFCRIGGRMLKKVYNSLCDSLYNRWPELSKSYKKYSLKA